MLVLFSALRCEVFCEEILVGFLKFVGDGQTISSCEVRQVLSWCRCSSNRFRFTPPCAASISETLKVLLLFPKKFSFCLGKSCIAYWLKSSTEKAGSKLHSCASHRVCVDHMYRTTGLPLQVGQFRVFCESVRWQILLLGLLLIPGAAQDTRVLQFGGKKSGSRNVPHFLQPPAADEEPESNAKMYANQMAWRVGANLKAHRVQSLPKVKSLPHFLYDPVGWLLQFFTDRKIMY